MKPSRDATVWRLLMGGRIIESGTFEELLERTIGSLQQLSLKFSEPQSQAPAPLKLNEDGLEATGYVDGNRHLANLLNHFNRYGIAISTITMREPTLQQMFLHLTGKELRE